MAIVMFEGWLFRRYVAPNIKEPVFARKWGVLPHDISIASLRPYHQLRTLLARTDVQDPMMAIEEALDIAIDSSDMTGNRIVNLSRGS